MHDLRDKVAAVTGAASGIGRALAFGLVERGARVALCDVDEKGVADAADQLSARGAAVTWAAVDVANREAVHTWADRVLADHGRANLVFNNAGVALTANIEDMSYEDLEWLIGINFWGVVHGTKAFLPHLIASGDGHVVNVSSVFGMIGVPSQSAYNAAKFAVRGFTEALRQELEIAGHPVSATCVHPGGIRTNIVANSRLQPTPDTPTKEEAQEQFRQAARHTPEKAARIILDGVQRNRRRILIGWEAHLIDWLQRVAPAGYQRLFTAVGRRRIRQMEK